MRKLVHAFYNDDFSFSRFLQKYPEQRVNLINLLIGDVFKEGVDGIYEPMSDFAEIPEPLFEQIVHAETNGKAEGKGLPQEVLSAKYVYYDDRVISAREA